MKKITGFLIIATLLCSMFALSVTSFASEVSNIPIDGDSLGTHVDTELYLVCASKNSYVYASDKKTKLFTVGKGDSMIFDARKSVSDGTWSMILVDFEGYDGDTAYIKTSSLVKTKSGAVSKRRPSITFQGMFASVSKSKYVYKTDGKSERVGIIRKGIRLPVYTDSKDRHRVCTYYGAATVLPSYLKLFTESGWTWG